MARTRSRTARIFLSSTFRDFGEERDLLVRRVFPTLRGRLNDRCIELVDVDLRWGITAEQAERGEVLPICLAEIDRSRPFFVGLLGERYGWIPPADGYPAHVVESQPWLEAHRGGKSVTELEILHGVLNDPKMAGRALFYFRNAGYAEIKGGDYVPASAEDARRQAELKERIRQSGFPVVEDYADPAALAETLEADLWAVLDETFPAAEVPDAFAREAMRHEAYAAPRRGLYLGGEPYLKALDEALASGKQWILIGGQSGGGKSALIANWAEALERTHEDLVLHVHYLGATADASDPVSLVRRLVEAIRRTVGSEEEIPGDPEKLLEALPLWLANASSWSGLKGKRFVIIIDALNGLTDWRDLRWFPSFLPERVQLVVSSLPSEVQDQLRKKAKWTDVAVRPLDREKAEELFVAYLRRFNKELPPDLVSRIVDHELVSNPLFLRTLAEELRVFGVHERLGERLEHYLASKTVDDLFERVLERVEEDNGADTVRKVMVGLWASRAGLTEEEIRAWADLKPAEWAYIQNALGNALLEGSGRVVFGHDYLRIAVSDRYLAGNNALQDEGQSPEAIRQRQNAHIELAKWFVDHAFQPEDTPGFRVADARAAEEIPHQWREAKDWSALKTCLNRREVFEAIDKHRAQSELLTYWLDLEQEADADIELDYETAWKDWAPEEDTEATGRLASALQSFLSYAGRYGAFTERLARLALRIESSTHGESSTRAATNFNNLALLLQNKGDYAAAELLYRRALEITEGANGPAHLNTLASRINLGQLLRLMGKNGEAEPILRQALEFAETVQGSKHIVKGAALNALALLLHFKGDFNAAGLLYRQALDIAGIVLGPKHPQTATALVNLGLLLKDTGDFDAAERLYRQALEIDEDVLGPEHPDTASTLVYLAGLLEEAGRAYAVAEPLYRRALDIREKALGTEHPDTATSLNNLGLLLFKQKKIKAAEPLFQRSLAIIEKVLGVEAPYKATVLNNLGLLLQQMGDYAGAESLHRRALAITEKAQGSEHPSTAIRLDNLGLLLSKKGDLSTAEWLCRRALRIFEQSFGEEHPSTKIARSNLRAYLESLGRRPDPQLLISRGDFVLVTNYAKAVAGSLNEITLTPVHFLAGTIVAGREDAVWGEEISQLLSQEVRRRVTSAYMDLGVDLSDDFRAADSKMSLSDDLKQIIGANMRTSMRDLIRDILHAARWQ